MSGFPIKLITCPTVALASDMLTRQVFFPNIRSAVILGIVLAVAAQLLEYLILEKGTFWLSNIMDFVTATTIAFLSPLFITGIRVTFPGAALIAFLLVITEYFVHLLLIRTGVTTKA